jgi:hypothetical protein
MGRSSSLLALLALVALGGGCTRTCKSGTIFLALDFDAVSAGSETLLVAITVGGVTRVRTVAHSRGQTSGNIEIDFTAGYPHALEVAVSVQALAGSTLLGSGAGAIETKDSCEALTIHLKSTTGGNDDMGLADLAGDDSGSAAPTDFAGCGAAFVSQLSGADSESGCDPAHAKLTIAGGLSVASAHDVLVCAGNYVESISVSRPVALRGGYDCATWTRTSSFGYPTFDAAHRTSIFGTAIAAPAVDVSAGATVEGITAQAGNSTTQTAMLVRSPDATITDNQILAGSLGNVPNQGSIGLDIESGDSFITHNSINGGGAQTNATTTFSAGSTGVYYNGGSALSANTINPGNGSLSTTSSGSPGGVGAVGVWVNNSASSQSFSVISDNIISGGSGSANVSSDADTVATLGMLITSSDGRDVEILHNVIDANSGSLSAPSVTKQAPVTAGILVRSTNNSIVDLNANRIFGGTSVGPNNLLTLMSAGVWIESPLVTLRNNEIQSGSTSAGSVAAIAIIAQANMNIVGTSILSNTIVSGRATSGTGVYIDVGGSGIMPNQLADNLILGETSAVAVAMTGCLGSGDFAQWQDNATAYTAILRENLSGGAGCAANTLYTSDDAVDTAFNTECAAVGNCSQLLHSGNVNFMASCSGSDSGCAVLANCTNPGSAGADVGPCARQLFTAFDSSTDGVATLESTGWNLAPGAPCKLTKGGTDFTMTVPTDWQGNQRTAPISIGASESDAACM